MESLLQKLCKFVITSRKSTWGPVGLKKEKTNYTNLLIQWGKITLNRKTATLFHRTEKLHKITGKKQKNKNKKNQLMLPLYSQHNISTIIQKKWINFGQNTAIWTLTTAYPQLDTSTRSEKLCVIPITNIAYCTSRWRVPGKSGTFAWVAGAVLLRKALFCFIWIFFFNTGNNKRRGMRSDCLLPHCCKKIIVIINRIHSMNIFCGWFDYVKQKQRAINHIFGKWQNLLLLLPNIL